MKKNEVKIGDVYTAKVTNKVVQVRIDAESRYGGWDATNLSTKKKIRIKSPAKLRSVVGGQASATATNKSKGEKKAKAETAPKPAQTSASKAKDSAAKASNEQKPDKPKRTRATKALKEKRVSGLDAAAKVLQEIGPADDDQGDGRGGRGQGLLEISRRQDAARHGLLRDHPRDRQEGRRVPIQEDRTREVHCEMLMPSPPSFQPRLCSGFSSA